MFNDYGDNIRRIYRERWMSADHVLPHDVEKIITVVTDKVIPYFHKVFKTENDITLDRLGKWVTTLFTSKSNMQVVEAGTAINDETKEFIVHMTVRYKSAELPVVIVGRADLPGFGLLKTNNRR
jgi:hypothetical protein